MPVFPPQNAAGIKLTHELNLRNLEKKIRETRKSEKQVLAARSLRQNASARPKAEENAVELQVDRPIPERPFSLNRQRPKMAFPGNVQ